MIDVLHAEESLRAVTELAIGTGHAPSDVRRRVLSQWQRDLGMKPVRSDPRALTGVGIRIVRVKAKAS